LQGFPPAIQGVKFLSQTTVQFSLATEPAVFIFGASKARIIPEIHSVLCNVTS
jgi:hypothetical protein